MPKIEPFEKYYEEYDKWFDEYKIIYQTEIKAIKKLLPKGKGIEIGVGSGRFAIPLKIKDGLEPSIKMRNIAIKRGINVIDGVAEKIPIDSNEYDFALLMTTLCFLDDINASLKEIKRILKPKGYIVIGFIDKNSPIGKLYLKIKDQNPFYKIANFHSTEEIIQHLIISGFSNFEIIQTIFGESIEDIKKIQKPIKGYDKGSFIVIKAKKAL